MCESAFLNHRNRKNLYVPTLRKKSCFRSENHFFSLNKAEILNLLATEKPVNRGLRTKNTDSAVL